MFSFTVVRVVPGIEKYGRKRSLMPVSGFALVEESRELGYNNTSCIFISPNMSIFERWRNPWENPLGFDLFV